jgi:hypothetical protein
MRNRLLAARFRPAFGDTVRTEAEDASRGLRAIDQLSVQMSRSPHPRKVLVFIGAAWLFSPKEPTPFADREPELGRDWYHRTHRIEVKVNRPGVTVHAGRARG